MQEDERCVVLIEEHDSVAARNAAAAGQRYRAHGSGCHPPNLPFADAAETTPPRTKKPNIPTRRKAVNATRQSSLKDILIELRADMPRDINWRELLERRCDGLQDLQRSESSYREAVQAIEQQIQAVNRALETFLTYMADYARLLASFRLALQAWTRR
jgi:hypothetical protein